MLCCTKKANCVAIFPTNEDADRGSVLSTFVTCCKSYWTHNTFRRAIDACLAVCITARQEKSNPDMNTK